MLVLFQDFVDHLVDGRQAFLCREVWLKAVLFSGFMPDLELLIMLPQEMCPDLMVQDPENVIEAIRDRQSHDHCRSVSGVAAGGPGNSRVAEREVHVPDHFDEDHVVTEEVFGLLDGEDPASVHFQVLLHRPKSVDDRVQNSQRQRQVLIVWLGVSQRRSDRGLILELRVVLELFRKENMLLFGQVGWFEPCQIRDQIYTIPIRQKLPRAVGTSVPVSLRALSIFREILHRLGEIWLGKTTTLYSPLCL